MVNTINIDINLSYYSTATCFHDITVIPRSTNSM